MAKIEFCGITQEKDGAMTSTGQRRIERRIVILGIIFAIKPDEMCRNNLTDISTIIQNVPLRFGKLYYLAK
jgi:hypothetical protein